MARQFLQHAKILIAAGALMAVLLTATVAAVVWGQPPGDDGGQDDVVAEIRHLWKDLGDFDGARALARRFFDTHPEYTQLRHRVEYENAFTYLVQGNYGAATPLFDAIVDAYGAADFTLPEGALSDPAVLVDDALYQSGWSRQAAGDQAGALGVYELLLEEFPGTNRAARAHQFINRALIHLDLDQWRNEVSDGRWVAAHAAEVDANVTSLIAAQPDDPCVPEVLLDAINYFKQPEWWMHGAGVEGDGKVAEYALRLLDDYPDAKQTAVARCELAEILLRTDPAVAMTLIETSLDLATRNADADLRRHALFMKGAVLSTTGQHAAAEAAFRDVLASDPSPEVEAEATLAIGFSLARRGDLLAATDTFLAIVTNESYREDDRAMAAFSLACELWHAGHEVEAREALQVVLQLFPSSSSAATAIQLQAIWDQR